MATQARAPQGSATVAYDFNQGTSASGNKGLYRENDSTRPANIMYDRRVVRGSTYAMPIITPSTAAAVKAKEGQQQFKRTRALAAAKAAEEAAARVHTPPAVSGRRHADMNTEVYIEVLQDRVPEEEAGVQTDAIIDRPPSPIFVPQPSGTDKYTQIEAGELFDFDFEVSPLLDTLIGKTLEQSLAEVIQEDELAAIRAKQAEYEAVRSAELAEVQRLEAEVKRRFAEKQRRIEQEAARLKRETEVREKIAAGAFARSYLSSLRRGVFTQLHESGHFYDPVRREMETLILPDVFAKVAERLTNRQTSSITVLDDVILSALTKGNNAYEQRLAAEKAEADAREAARIAAEEAAAKAKADAEAEAKAKADAEAAAAAEGQPPSEGGEAPAE